MHPKSLSIFLMALILTGCCSGKTRDPRTGGFIGGLQGIFCGDYQPRIEERQAEASRQHEITTALQTEANERERLYRLRMREQTSQKQRQEEMERYIKSLSSDLNLLNATTVEQKSKITALKNEIAQVQAEINNLKFSDSDNEATSQKITVLEKKRDYLAEEWKALLEYFNAFSESVN